MVGVSINTEIEIYWKFKLGWMTIKELADYYKLTEEQIRKVVGNSRPPLLQLERK